MWPIIILTYLGGPLFYNIVLLHLLMFWLLQSRLGLGIFLLSNVLLGIKESFGVFMIIMDKNKNCKKPRH